MSHRLESHSGRSLAESKVQTAAADLRSAGEECAQRRPGPETRSDFANDPAGAVAMMFGLMMFTVILFIGAAVDFGRWLNARDQTLSAIDASVLAAGRALQTGATEAAALALAQRYYDNNVETRIKVEDDTVRFVITNNGATVAAEGTAYIRTPFMGLGNVMKLPLFVASEAPEATTAHDTTSDVNREVSLMLDVSGSMCIPCSKRDDMKAAAKDLVEILMKNNGKSPYWAKVALVPFSGAVRPPSDIYAKVIDPNWPESRTFGGSSGSGSSGHGSWNTGGFSVTYDKTKCVAERTASNKFTDAAPGPGDYVMSTYNLDLNGDGVGECSLPEADTMRPLSDNKADVITAIDGLVTAQSTAGHIGTAWSYYFLSPKWNSVLPEASHALPYGTPKLRKFAVLMTDGEYNSEYDKLGLPVGLFGAGSSANGSNSAGQAVALCNQMKHDDIEIYTVGFDLGGNQTAIDTLKKCATDASKAYTVDTGDQLKQAFRDIAVRLSQLHISK